MMFFRSRMKFVRFFAIPFTSRTAIDAHEAAFNFSGWTVPGAVCINIGLAVHTKARPMECKADSILINKWFI